MAPKKKSKKGRKKNDDEGKAKKKKEATVREQPPPIIVPFEAYKGSVQNASLRPACLDEVMFRAVKSDYFRRAGRPEPVVNDRFVNGIFMPQVDVQAVKAVLEPVDLESIIKAQDEQDAATRDCAMNSPTRRRVLSAEERQRQAEQEGFAPWKELMLNEVGDVYKATSPPKPKPQFPLTKSVTLPPGQSLSRLGGLDERSIITLPALSLAQTSQSPLHLGLEPETAPGHSILLGEVQKYFGPQARSEFFEQYRSIAQQSLSFADGEMGLATDEGGNRPLWMSKAAATAALLAKKALSKPARELRKREPFSYTLNEMGKEADVPVVKKKQKKPEEEGQEDPPPESSEPIKATEPPLPLALPARWQKRQESWLENVDAYRKSLDQLDKSLLAGPDYQFFVNNSGPLSPRTQYTKVSLDFMSNKSPEFSLASFSAMQSSVATQDEEEEDDDKSRVSSLKLRLRGMGISQLSPQSSLMSGSNMFTIPAKGDVGDGSGEGAGGSAVLSPRTAYLAACIDNKVAPLPKVILRKSLSTVVNLSHYRMGDVLGSALAGGISALPSIESINLRDNNLTDKALQPILQSIRSVRGVQQLDLSQNKIDEQASEALAAYLSDPTCSLMQLVMENADVDDAECCKFITYLESNNSLELLDLSNNLLGSHEMVYGAKTGGGALADFLNHPACRLRTLSLQWNKIRGKSALALASAVELNSTLTYLDLSYNGLGSAGGEVLGASLLENKTLHTLVIKNNNITSTACVSLCIGAGQNRAMTRLVLDENPIGEKGARAVMNLPLVAGDRVSVSAVACNTKLKDAACFYDPANVVGVYKLDLSKAFHRAVAFSVLQIVAAHSTCVIQKATFANVREGRGPLVSFAKEEKLELMLSVASDKEQYFDEEQKAVLAGLRLLEAAASDVTKATQLFHEADLDNSGELDRYEMQLILARLGIGAANNPKRFADIMGLFDLDGSGLMGLDDFLSLVKSQRLEASSRIRELTQYSVMALASRPGQRYIPPTTGQLTLTVVDGFVQKAAYSVLSENTHKSTLAMARVLGDANLLNAAIKNTRLHTQEAYDLFRSMYKETGRLLPSLSQILPQMESAGEAKRLLSLVTNDDERVMQHVKSFLGTTVGRVAFGITNGYYLLDLSVEMHRGCLAKLLEISQEVASRRGARFARALGSDAARGRIGDASQHGNWSCFRNEVFNHERTEITPEAFTPMPKSGVVEFDFCSSAPAASGEASITNARFCRVLSNLCLLQSPPEEKEAVRKLDMWAREVRFFAPVVPGSSADSRVAARRKDGYMAVHQNDEARALEMALARDAFYGLLLSRKNQNREALAREKKGQAWAAKQLTALPDPLLQSPTPSPSQTTPPIAAVQEQQEEEQRGGGSEGEGEGEEEEEVGVGEEGMGLEEGEEGEEGHEEGDEPSAWQGLAEPSMLTAPSAALGGASLRIAQSARAAALEQQRASLKRLLDLDPSQEEERFPPRSSSGSPLFGSPAQPSSRKTLAHSAGPSLRGSMRGGGLQSAAAPTPAQMMQIAANKAAALELRRSQVTVYKAVRLVQALEDTLCGVWMRARHLALLVQLLTHGDVARTPDFGSYAVELCCALFSRVLDVHNMELVLRVLPARDAGILSARLGLLSLFVPVKPEGCVRLALSRPEERRVLKMLLALAAAENGKRSIVVVKQSEEFPLEIAVDEAQQLDELDEGEEGDEDGGPRYRSRPTKSEEQVRTEVAATAEMVDLELPAAWSTAGGLPKTGHVMVTYTTGAVQSGMTMELEAGLRANRLLRRSLTNCTLSDESVVDIDDEDDDDIRAHLGKIGLGNVDSVASKFISQNLPLFEQVLE